MVLAPSHASKSRPTAAPEFEAWSPSELLQLALGYRAWGWTCIPVGANKKPLGRWKHWQFRRPADRDIARMFERSGVSGLAIVLGLASGFRSRNGQCVVMACRDFDDVAGYERWATLRPELAAKLPTVRTRRGYHVYCRLVGDERFVNELPDGDLRADSKHYAVLPPSRHPLGGHYQWTMNEPFRRDAVPVLTLADAGFLDSYRVRESSALTPVRPTRITAGATGPPVTRTSRQKPKEATHDLCPKQDSVVQFNQLAPPIREAVLRTLPTRPGQRNDKLLSLARALTDIAPGVRAGYWRDAVREWHRLSLPVIRTKEWGETWRDFLHAWDCAGAYPMSASRPKAAFAAGVASAEGQPDRQRLLVGCRALAAEAGQPFAISVRVVADALAISRMTAHRLLARLVVDGRLVVVRRGEPSPTKRIATYFRLGA
jgi:hypothetical protein